MWQLSSTLADLDTAERHHHCLWQLSAADRGVVESISAICGT
jgi:hypothetical protein